MTFLLLVAVALIALIEAPGLIRGKAWYELTVFFIFLGGGAALGMLQIFDVQWLGIAKLLPDMIQGWFGR
ncbi:MAG: hypothetical protein LBT22_00480 [Peptococcaceae bacterium]|nr:hypothetical protein [Peptococcaceae bacterium]